LRGCRDREVIVAARGQRRWKSVTFTAIKNCDTMKKARAWLKKQGFEYSFHDYKTAGIERDWLERWCKKSDWETLLNRDGTTFLERPDKAKTGLDAKKAIELVLAEPSYDQAAGPRTRRR
jgi:arsenate reductase (glutaredoxin)